MISILHLLWIIPLVTFFGFMLGAVMAVGKEKDEHSGGGEMSFTIPTSVLKVRDENGNVYEILAIQGRPGQPGAPGDPGKTPNLTIGTVETLPEGSEATATITGTPEDPILNLGIPIGNTPEVVFPAASKQLGGVRISSGGYSGMGVTSYGVRPFPIEFRPKILIIQETPEQDNTRTYTIIDDYYITLDNYDDNICAVAFTDSGFEIYNGTASDSDGNEIEYAPFNEIGTNYAWIAIG